MISSEEAYLHYTNVLKNKSAGVYGVTCDEVVEQKLQIIEDREPYEEHISINFHDVSKNGRKSKSRKLASYAFERGSLYAP